MYTTTQSTFAIQVSHLFQHYLIHLSPSKMADFSSKICQWWRAMFGCVHQWTIRTWPLLMDLGKIRGNASDINYKIKHYFDITLYDCRGDDLIVCDL